MQRKELRYDRIIRVETILTVSTEDVWQAWTTPQGITAFLAPACNIELKVNGPYEILFDLEAEAGKRGSEGAHILALQPPNLLSFTWNAPPEFPKVRQQWTCVVVRFSEATKGGTLVTLTQGGWPSSGSAGNNREWDKVYQYFIHAWRDVVFPRMRYRFQVGPLDWDHVPNTHNQQRFIEFFDTSVYNTHTPGG